GDCSSLCCDGLAVEPSRSPGSSDLRSSERRYPRVYYSAATWTSNYACFRLASDFTPDEMTEEVPRTQMVSRNSAKKYMSDKIVFTRSRSFGTEPIEFAQIMDTERSAVLIRVVQSFLRHTDIGHWTLMPRVQVRSFGSECGDFGRYFGRFTSRQEA